MWMSPFRCKDLRELPLMRVTYWRAGGPWRHCYAGAELALQGSHHVRDQPRRICQHVANPESMKVHCGAGGPWRHRDAGAELALRAATMCEISREDLVSFLPNLEA